LAYSCYDVHLASPSFFVARFDPAWMKHDVYFPIFFVEYSLLDEQMDDSNLLLTISDCHTGSNDAIAIATSSGLAAHDDRESKEFWGRCAANRRSRDR
jgi:hypothetical protein